MGAAGPALGIAVVGIWWVVSQLSLRDHVLLLDDKNIPIRTPLVAAPAKKGGDYVVLDPRTGGQRSVARDRLVNSPDRPGLLKLRDGRSVRLLALDLDKTRAGWLLVKSEGSEKAEWIAPGQVQGGYAVKVPHPIVEAGLAALVRQANPWLLGASLLIFPFTFIICSIRWNALMRALDIHLPQARTFVLSMVGSFYNTFMPGSTGGDLLKAYYASKHTPHRTHAVLSVLIDRIIGLLALIILGGLMATLSYYLAPSKNDAGVEACRQVAIGAGAIMASFALMLLVFLNRGIRCALGLDYLIRKLPAQKHVQHAIQVAKTYRSRPGLVTLALVATFPVHLTVVVAALLAGKAFGLGLPAPFYFVAVPVIVLAGALPLSPQGAGVMEFFAIQLTRQHGVAVSEAFVLAMCIRLQQVLWNLTGGYFVLRGGYHAPTRQEQKEMEDEEDEEEREMAEGS